METEQSTEKVNHNAWLTERRTGIGGSDAAAILGVSPYSTAIDVWMDKKGLKPPSPDREVMWWGRELEGLIRRRYEETTGFRTAKPDAILRHPTHNVLLGNPDGIVLNAPRPRGLEIKTASVRVAHQWGEPGTDAVPPHYLVQCCHYMLVTGFAEWDVAVLVGGSDFRVYPIRADVELLNDMRDQLLAWWQRHIVEGVEPDVDSSDAAREYLARKHPQAVGQLEKATPDVEKWAEVLAEARGRIATMEEAKALAENKLKEMIGDRLGFEGRGWRARWSNVKAGSKVDWQRVASLLGARLMDSGSPGIERKAIEEVELAATTERPASRRFLFTQHGKED